MPTLATEPQARRTLATRPHCVDCPTARTRCFEVAVGAGSSSCRFVKSTLSARAPIPSAWSTEYALVLVRRGVLVRTRSPKDGPSIAIDCVGPGSSLPLSPTPDDVGYAATEARVCLYPRAGLDRALAGEQGTARDVIGVLGRALDRVERFAAARGHGAVDARIARVLAVIADTLSPPRRSERLPPGLQQRDLARLAGVRHESFCRAIGKLERAGMVRREAEGLSILAHDALATFAG